MINIYIYIVVRVGHTHTASSKPAEALARYTNTLHLSEDNVCGPPFKLRS